MCWFLLQGGAINAMAVVLAFLPSNTPEELSFENKLAKMYLEKHMPVFEDKFYLINDQIIEAWYDL
jgi:hypothetical protein